MGEAREVSDSTGAHHATGRLTPKIPYRGLRRETPPIMATTVGPARVKADNSADRCSIAQNVWLPVRRFHVGTSTKMLTLDAGYTTATDSRVDLPTAFLLCRGRSPYTKELDGVVLLQPIIRPNVLRSKTFSFVQMFKDHFLVGREHWRFGNGDTIVVR